MNCLSASTKEIRAIRVLAFHCKSFRRVRPNGFCVVCSRRKQVYFEVSGVFYLQFVVLSSLHSVCYERVPWYPTVLTFILSALWHGVYPGYYFTFLTGVLVTLAARAVSFLWV